MEKLIPDDFQLAKLTAIELVTLLDKSFPPRCILPGETVESAHRYAGQRDLIDDLIAMRDEEEEADKAQRADAD